MKLDIKEYDLGVKVFSPKINNDERGFVSEVFRSNWNEFFGNEIPQQINISKSKPGIVRAWHRHLRKQVDFFTVIFNCCSQFTIFQWF